MNLPSIPINGFTTRANGRASVLKNEVHVSEAHDPKSGTTPPVSKPYIGIWDTGATGTVICKKIADDLGLKPSGKVTVHAVSSTREANTYLVNIHLPNKVEIVAVRVAEGEIAGADLLLGMDIIGEGDFAITQCNGKTCWTFRTPSIKEIDFVKEINDGNRISSTQRHPLAAAR